MQEKTENLDTKISDFNTSRIEKLKIMADFSIFLISLGGLMILLFRTVISFILGFICMMIGWRIILMIQKRGKHENRNNS